MSTKNRAVLSTEIVPEVLIKKKNYKEWSFRLRTYLKAQDVWDIIEPTSNEAVDYKVWEKKNATALHAIHISCGPDAFSLIEGIPEAKGICIDSSLAIKSDTMSSSKIGGIVPEDLNEETYVDWSARIQTYLLAGDHWDITVESSGDEPPKAGDHEDGDRGEAENRAWRKKNATALHVIQLCFGPLHFL
ncbi:hypothetical protein FEM48_Zijuj03G0043600 [Ziziphus jujuba var. spinosa]|uniref:DUF4219 domain-containing protein n=1 Tax=Ziziphus jujuba var. spinosa TaxID=714518 RepID=A0A978VN56_ZIZJJ|nr:hypothetical protein FEM48_Zijuj03G0043600 [Ziziphus jujuba var. spinosa]